MNDKPSSLNVRDIKVSDMVPNPDNINEMDDATLQRLVDEIEDVGFIDPVNVVPMSDGKYFILGGEHRWKAAQKIGLEYIPAVLHTDERWTDKDTVDLVAFRLNVLKGSQNPEKFMKTYERLATKFGADKVQDVFAVTDKSLWKKLTKSIKQELKSSGASDDMMKAVSDAEKKSKDFNQFTKLLGKVFEQQAKETSSGMIVFTDGNQEHMVVTSTPQVFAAMKALSLLTQARGQTMSDVLLPVVSELLKDQPAASV